MAAALISAARRASSSLSPRLSSPTSTANLIQRRGLAGAADHHGPPKFVIVSLTGWGLFIYGGFKLFSGGKKEKKEEKVVEASH